MVFNLTIFQKLIIYLKLIIYTFIWEGVNKCSAKKQAFHVFSTVSITKGCVMVQICIFKGMFPLKLHNHGCVFGQIWIFTDSRVFKFSLRPSTLSLANGPHNLCFLSFFRKMEFNCLFLASLKHLINIYADDSVINAADRTLKQVEAILQTDVDNIVKWFYKKTD